MDKSPYPPSVTSVVFLIISFLAVAYFGQVFLGKYVFSTSMNASKASVSGAVFNPNPSPIIGDNTTATPQTETKNTVTVQFFGDMMFDRGVRAQINSKGSEQVFGISTKALTDTADLTIANLEGPITRYQSKTINASGKGIPGFTFTFPTTTARLLKSSGIDIVSLANNHADNFGSDGLKQTVSYLKDQNVLFFGNPTNTIYSDTASSTINSSPISTTHCFEPKDGFMRATCIGLIGFHEFSYKNQESVIKEIRRLAGTVDFVIVMPHWGIEYKNIPNQNQISLAHSWIDAGADMIVGAHPHVIQSIEQYKDKFIFYSLGNFMFDQYFSYDTTHGMTLRFTLSLKSEENVKNTQDNNVHLQTIYLEPIDITGITLTQADANTKTKMLTKQAEISKKYVSNTMYTQIASGIITP